MTDSTPQPMTDLTAMIASLDPVIRDGEFVFVTTEGAPPAGVTPAAMILEDEGTTLVLTRSDADAAALPYSFVAAWITLTVHSALDAVGLTAAVSTVLAAEGISCNVLAAFHHDHLLVAFEDRDRAVGALRALAHRQPPAIGSHPELDTVVGEETR